MFLGEKAAEGPLDHGVPGAGFPVTSGNARAARAVIERLGPHDLGCSLVVSSAPVWQGQPRRTSDNEQALVGDPVA